MHVGHCHTHYSLEWMSQCSELSNGLGSSLISPLDLKRRKITTRTRPSSPTYRFSAPYECDAGCVFHSFIIKNTYQILSSRCTNKEIYTLYWIRIESILTHTRAQMWKHEHKLASQIVTSHPIYFHSIYYSAYNPELSLWFAVLLCDACLWAVNG